MRDFEESFGAQAREVWEASEELRYNIEGELSSREEFIEDYGEADGLKAWAENKPP